MRIGATLEKKYLPNFPAPKKSWNQNFKTQKNPLIIPVTWNLEHPLSWALKGDAALKRWYNTDKIASNDMT